MAKNRWIKGKTTVLMLILLGVFMTGTMVSCVKTVLSGGKKDHIQIQTEYCDLYYPSRWGENVKIVQTEDTVQFWAVMEGYGLLPLFDIHFDSDEGSFYGMITAEDGTEVPVSLTVYAIEPDESWSQEQCELLYGMQEDLDSLLSKLPIVASGSSNAQEDQQASDMTESPETAPESSQTEENQQAYGEIEIVTPYGVLRYPDTWKGYLRLNEIEADVYTVEFYANVEGHPEQHLFDVQVGSSIAGGVVWYTVNEETVFLNITVLQKELDETWEEDDADIIYGMLDDINYLLDQIETAEST